MRDLIKLLYGSEKEYRRVTAAREAERLADAYPPRVQEALDLVERETAAYEQRERQAACAHEKIHAAEERTMGDPVATVMSWCGACGMKVTPRLDE